MNLVLYDGFCNLCNYAVMFIIKRDINARFKFASIQSTIGQDILRHYNLDRERIDSIVYIKGGKYFLRSSAMLNILKDLGGTWKLLYSLILIPRFIRDSAYNLIAQTRYKLFGKRDNCLIPSDALKDRFVD